MSTLNTPDEVVIAALIEATDEEARSAIEAGDPTFFETQWVRLTDAQKRETVIEDLRKRADQEP